MSRVAIIGSGLIGRAWALVFARAGWSVVMTDNSPDILAGLESRLAEECAILERHDLAGPAAELLERIAVKTTIAEAVGDVDFVQENGPEDVDIKRAIFAELDRHAPSGAILASSTSAIVSSRFTEALEGRSRCLVGHPVNPPHLVPVVELCGAPWTAEDTINRAREVYTAIGQVPVLVRQEIDGFVLNRLQGALLAEAFRLVRDGIVSPEDLDHTVSEGLGLRWSFLGPFETIELNAPGGMADYCDRYCGFYRRLTDDPPTPSVFSAASAETILQAWPFDADSERLTKLTQRRNARLAALNAHKKQFSE